MSITLLMKKIIFSKVDGHEDSDLILILVGPPGLLPPALTCWRKPPQIYHREYILLFADFVVSAGINFPGRSQFTSLIVSTSFIFFVLGCRNHCVLINPVLKFNKCRMFIYCISCSNSLAINLFCKHG